MPFSLFRRAPEKEAARKLYETIVDQARQPVFYERGGVSDSLDGRFDMIVLHVIVVLHRLKGKPFAALSQNLFDTFFADMDEALRDMGVGDLSVPKKIKAMSEAVYGRIAAYNAGLEAETPDALAEAVARNVFRTEEVTPRALTFAVYLREQAETLRTIDDAAIAEGRIRFTQAPDFA